MVIKSMHTPLRRRAVRPEHKLERRDRLIAAGHSLFAQQPLELITVAGLARTAGVAKGTFYLYFDTKEALFLAIVRHELAAWFDAVDVALDQPDHNGSKDARNEAMVKIIATALRERPMLPRLLAVLHTVLECNIDYDTALEFKTWLRTRSLHTGALLESALDCLTPGEGVLLILRMHALTIGFQHAANPAPVIRQVLDAEPDLDLFRVDFFDSFSATLRAVLAGWPTNQGENHD